MDHSTDRHTTMTHAEQDLFPTDPVELPQVVPTEIVEIRDGESYALHITSVSKQIGDATVRMLAYNSSIPGPTLRVRQGSQILVAVTNDGDTEATVHWHGLRLENRYDGVPYDTQAPIPIGGSFTYHVTFPDAGIYWYHPHVREDYGLEMGLYGAIVVEPADASYWPPVDRELTLTLDDLLVEDGKIAPFRRSGPTYTAMGRFGNVLLINGEPEFAGQAAVGEVVRLYLVNTANTRIFNVAVNGARMKLVGGDSGRYEHDSIVEEALLAPSERAVVDVLFNIPGEVQLEHRTPDRVYALGTFTVVEAVASSAARSFDVLGAAPELVAERQRITDDMTRAPDKELSFVASMPLLYGEHTMAASSYACPMHPDVTSTEPSTCPRCGVALIPVQTAKATTQVYSCPMHPEVTASEPGKCPTCGMKLVLVQTAQSLVYTCPMHPDVTATQPGTCPKCGMKLVSSAAAPSTPEVGRDHSHEHGERHGGDGLEWEDLMPDINRRTDPTNMIWKIIDRETGAVNGAIRWTLTVGDRVKIRLVNEMESDHPMHHPFHIHGAGRFLILARDARPEPNLVWKDTVLIRAGETVDILLDATNPGLWMAHCHIAEHAQSGMMFSFEVRPR